MYTRRSKKDHHEDESWLITYADFITLLIAFFLTILSVSEPKKEEMEKMKDSLSQFVDQKSASQPYADLLNEMKLMVESEGAEDKVIVEKSNRGLTLELAATSFYDPGSGEFRKDAIPILNAMGDRLKKFDQEDYLVSIEGHTDDTAIHNAQFPSNWELSAVRAVKIVRYFIAMGMPANKFRAAGYADTVPKVPNLDDKGQPIPENRELNRRIMIKIERRE